MTKKSNKTVRPPVKGAKKGKSITTTSVAFKTKNIEALKKHELHAEKDLSVSWIINKLIEKLVAGEISLD